MAEKLKRMEPKASRGWRSREARPRPDLATRQCQTVPRHDGGLRRKPRASAAWGRAPSGPVLTPISQPRSTISRQLALDAADVEPARKAPRAELISLGRTSTRGGPR